MKVVNSIIFTNHCNTFFNRHQVFLNFYYRQAIRNFNGINFNYTYILHLALAIRIYFDKNLIYPKVQTAKIMLE